MTKMLARVTGPEQSLAALAAGADIIELADGAGSFAAPSAEDTQRMVGLVAGRAVTGAVVGAWAPDWETAAQRLSGDGVQQLSIGFLGTEAIAAHTSLLRTLAREGRVCAVLFADQKPDLEHLDAFAKIGFAAISLDIYQPSNGRVLDHASPAAVGDFFDRARSLGLEPGVSGGLEAPDIPRLMHFNPGFLGFSEDDGARLAEIRELVPVGDRPKPAKTLGTDKIFVRDFVLPVQIGAYSFERGRTQKVRFDVVAEVARSDSRPEDMRHVVSYDVIMDGIRAIVERGHIQLSEALAEAVADHVLKSPRVVRVTVRVEKLELGAGGVGVEIERGTPR